MATHLGFLFIIEGIDLFLRILESLKCVFVTVAALAANDGLRKARILELAVAIKIHDRRVGHPVDVRLEAANAVA